MATTCDGIFSLLHYYRLICPCWLMCIMEVLLAPSILQSFFGFRTETLQDIHEGNLGARRAVLPHSSFWVLQSLQLWQCLYFPRITTYSMWLHVRPELCSFMRFLRFLSYNMNRRTCKQQSSVCCYACYFFSFCSTNTPQCVPLWSYLCPDRKSARRAQWPSGRSSPGPTVWMSWSGSRGSAWPGSAN